MDFKKAGVMVVVLLFTLIFVSSCTKDTGASFDITDFQDYVQLIGGMGFLGLGADSILVSFLRILIGVLVFILMFEASKALPFNPNARIAIAIIISIISIIFIPGEILAGISAAYATLVSIVLIGLPVGGGLYAFFMMPHTTRGEIVIRFAILAITLWVLFAIRTQALNLVGVV